MSKAVYLLFLFCFLGVEADSDSPWVCNMPIEPGPCKGINPVWGLDQKIRVRPNGRNPCVQFNYGGCGGNANRFATESECMTACLQDSDE